MRYTLTVHARKRMEERNVSAELLEEALDFPTTIGYDEKGQIMVKKLYSKRGKKRLLIIVGQFNEEVLRIVTLIDTSKVKKYL